jgi:hypothetical protein
MNDSMGGARGQTRGPRPGRRWCRTGGDIRCIFGPDIRVLFAIGWVAAGSGASATAQVAAPSCEECAETAFVPLYAPRPIALIAKVTSAVDATEDLWYLRDSLNEGLGVLSWNSHAQVVGTQFRYATPVTSTVPRAFVWLPQPQYNLPALVPHDLSALTNQASPEVPSFAWDISDEGLVVGGAGGMAESIGETAHAWNLPLLPPSPTPPPPGFELDFGAGPGDWTMALAITPSSNAPTLPRIVGCGSGACDEWRDPFEFFFVPTPHSAPLPHCTPPESSLGRPENISRRSWACDMASHASAPVGTHDQPHISGENPCDPGCYANGLCNYDCVGPMAVGVHFPCAFYRVETSPPNPVPPSDQKTGIRSSSGAPYGGDDSAPILAGYCDTRATPSSDACSRFAALWTYGTTSSVRNQLPSTLARTGTGALSDPIAQRWRRLECPCSSEVVVGWGNGPTGALWTTSLDPSQLGEFQAHPASELLVPFTSTPGPTVSVRQVYDILPTGEILALVRREWSATEYDLFACILGLRGDITGDHAVNAADLAWLLSSWGGPYEGDAPQVAADLNWDKSVGAADLTMLLNWWTSGGIRLLLPADGEQENGRSICMLQPGEACPETGADLKVDTARAEECMRCAIGAFGFEHTEDFTQWLSTAPPESVDAVCTCVSAMMRQMMEDHDRE